MLSVKTIKNTMLAAVLVAVPATAQVSGNGHPNLIVTEQDVANIAASWQSYDAYAEQLNADKANLDAFMAEGVVVPMPKDAGGGYTHEQHKRNYKAIRNAGFLYQVTGDEKYLTFAKDLLLAYAKMYPSLGEHPNRKEQSPGRLFWQSLNEAVWLVYSIQGYDAIIDGLTTEEKQEIESGVFLPMAKFLSVESPETFNKIHNHGTWAVAAVGMTGYVLGNDELVEISLMGLDKTGKAGFMKQLDKLFSPDGYYTEGPYYQRYALMPFIWFAKAIETNEPERKIFEYRNNILLKAVYTIIDLSYAGYFFPINDALKDKGIDTVELVHALAIAYSITGDNTLLDIAQEQGRISLTGDGLKVAKAIGEGLTQPYNYRSILLGDGADGDQGALSIHRLGEGHNHMALVAKNTSQGMGHGHFDKLNWLLYDNGNEIVTDYGAARYLNVEAKYGGHYLAENNTWAKQTIAHNTLVVNEQSHFYGDVTTADLHHPEVLSFYSGEDYQLSSAKEANAYDGVEFVRSMLLVNVPSLEHPIVVDVLNVSADKASTFDLPLHFNGQIIDFSFKVKDNKNVMKMLGKRNGYQHLWLRNTAPVGDASERATWILDDRFYSYAFVTSTPSKKKNVLIAELGANDPNYNLRQQQVLIRRVEKAKQASFVSVLEPHGKYDGSLETTSGAYSNVKSVKHVSENGKDVVVVDLKDGSSVVVALSYNANSEQVHKVNAGEEAVEWKGFSSVVVRSK
ncbi:exo-oligoalginate lyase Alg17 [Saccharophagus degradans]|uniref:Alginate lyase family protein n=1 Tax=Saccharophagus degradans TaxID=86304 RepID=A0AAW7X1J2_9GAMM|nr:exo-oligoalginate lyase Alg17 [Saccharophagus degradans]MDO6421352.1 alginate lyase family protein [Saccharophagus degradans]MDO6609549.1 alginate lyase family protein [Saccharophagus degradans]